MLYLSVDKNRIKFLLAKKSLFGQYSIASHQKKYQIDLLKNGRVGNIDVLASAIKEVSQPISSSKEKQVYLILPQETFGFIRTEVPSDIASSSIDSFIKDKIKSVNKDVYSVWYDYFFIENNDQKYISIFTLESAVATQYQEALNLLDLHIEGFIPEPLSYFKLFEKTLRKGKAEYILYGTYEKEAVNAYVYDSFGLLEKDRRELKLSSNRGVEVVLKQLGAELEKKNQKINRLILSGTASDTVRQDTFTKDVGMWTNPLKRIIPHFYQDYLKMLVASEDKSFSLLEYDACFGAFIFSLENKGFTLLKKKSESDVFTPKKTPFSFKPSFNFPISKGKVPKELLLFILSTIVSFGLFSIVSKSNFHFSLPNFPSDKKEIKITPTPLPPSPTPTPSLKREELKVKILNGSGTPGKASEVKDILKDKKYLEILTGNADNFDYTITEVQLKKEKMDAKGYILSDIQDYVSSPTITQADDAEKADVIIIVGSDFK